MSVDTHCGARARVAPQGVKRHCVRPLLGFRGVAQKQSCQALLRRLAHPPRCHLVECSAHELSARPPSVSSSARARARWRTPPDSTSPQASTHPSARWRWVCLGRVPHPCVRKLIGRNLFVPRPRTAQRRCQSGCVSLALTAASAAHDVAASPTPAEPHCRRSDWSWIGIALPGRRNARASVPFQPHELGRRAEHARLGERADGSASRPPPPVCACSPTHPPAISTWPSALSS